MLSIDFGLSSKKSLKKTRGNGIFFFDEVIKSIIREEAENATKRNIKQIKKFSHNTKINVEEKSQLLKSGKKCKNSGKKNIEKYYKMKAEKLIEKKKSI